jgi:hypothetical protein
LTPNPQGAYLECPKYNHEYDSSCGKSCVTKDVTHSLVAVTNALQSVVNACS